MAFIRVQKRGEKRYYYLVENERQGSKVKQTVLRYLGTSRPSKTEAETIIKEIRSKRK